MRVYHALACNNQSCILSVTRHAWDMKLLAEGTGSLHFSMRRSGRLVLQTWSLDSTACAPFCGGAENEIWEDFVHGVLVED